MGTSQSGDGGPKGVTYQIEVKRKARKALLRLPKKIQERIEDKIDSLSENPRPEGYGLVKNAPKGTFRVWVGRYRVVYVILDDVLVVVVVRVRKRDESTYRGL